jgi:hypothetical protein
VARRAAHGTLRRLVLLAAAAAVAGSAHAHIDTSSRVSRGERFLPRPDRARLWAVGFDAVLADYYWLNAVQLVGASDTGIGGQEPVLGRLIDLTTHLDPWVDHPYRFAAIWLTDSEASVRFANRLLRRGISYHPREWRNRYYLGFNLFYYLEDNRAAADVLEGALGLEGVPDYLGGLVARLRADTDDLQTAASFLRQLAASTEDPYAEAAYLKALDEILTESAARRLDRARIRYWRRYGRDIERVEDLVAGPRPVLRRLPPAHPHFGDRFGWELDEASGQIVSSFYGTRYRLHLHPADRERRERWRVLREGQPAGEGT